jgi:hypothetical protein
VKRGSAGADAPHVEHVVPHAPHLQFHPGT